MVTYAANDNAHVGYFLCLISLSRIYKIIAA